MSKSTQFFHNPSCPRRRASRIPRNSLDSRFRGNDDARILLIVHANILSVLPRNFIQSCYSPVLCDGVTLEACPECYRRVPPLENPPTPPLQRGERGDFAFRFSSEYLATCCGDLYWGQCSKPGPPLLPPISANLNMYEV